AGLREEAERVVLGVAAQEDAPLALPRDLLGEREAEHVAVEPLGSRQVVHEQLDRADLGDLERPRQEDAVHVVGGRHRFDVAGARPRVAPARQRLLHLLVLGHVRRGPGGEARSCWSAASLPKMTSAWWSLP